MLANKEATTFQNKHAINNLSRFLQPLATPSRPLGDGGAMIESDRMMRKLDKE